MKRTKKLMFATLMATTAIAMLLMSKAFAAPAGTTTSTCPTKSTMIKQLAAKGVSIPANTKLTTSQLQKLLDRYGIKLSTAANCPKVATEPAPEATAAPKPTTTPAPTATPKPTTTPAPTATAAPTTPVTGSMSADEQKMINLVNQDRANNGLKPVTFDATLRVPALKHSQDMSQNNFFSHTSPTYGTFSERLKASGVKYSTAGENIAMYGSVEAAEVAFMNSEGHRANILNANYTRIGIGIVYNASKGSYYITQWFAK